MADKKIRTTISGSYRKFADNVCLAIEAFHDLGVDVLSPKSGRIISYVDGFVSLEGDIVARIDRVSETYLSKAMKAVENQHLRAIQDSDFLWLILGDGYLGNAASFEFGWALSHNIPVYCLEKEYHNSSEPIVKSYANPVHSIEYLVHNFNPEKARKLDTASADRLLISLSRNIIQPTEYGVSPPVAVGGIVVDFSDRKYSRTEPRDVLFVKTGTWGEMFTLVGGKISRGQDVREALQNEVMLQTGLECSVHDLICAFNEIKDTDFYRSRLFVDWVVKVGKKESKGIECCWMPPEEAVKNLNLEPNAKKTLKKYIERYQLEPTR